MAVYDFVESSVGQWDEKGSVDNPAGDEDEADCIHDDEGDVDAVPLVGAVAVGAADYADTHFFLLLFSYSWDDESGSWG